jgi:uncharacterized heparinase superfamily protein
VQALAQLLPPQIAAQPGQEQRAAGTDLAAMNARALVGDWIDLCGRRIASPGWDPTRQFRLISALLRSRKPI